jgi:hypothetical protein
MKKLKFGEQHNDSYKVLYKPCYINEDYTAEVTKDDLLKLSKQACYSKFFTRYTAASAEGFNGICTMHIIIPTTVHLTTDEIRRWIAVCIQHKMLPEYVEKAVEIIPNDELENSHYIMCPFKCEDVSQGLMYLYFNTFRELYEDQGFVKSVLYMHDEMDINFYAAYVIGSFLNKVGTGHHILPITTYSFLGNYKKASGMRKLKSLCKDDPGAELDIHIVRALHNFVNNEGANRGLPIKQKGGKDAAKNWGCLGLINGVADEERESHGQMSIPIHLLDHPLADELFSAPSKDCVEILNKIKEEGT